MKYESYSRDELCQGDIIRQITVIAKSTGLAQQEDITALRVEEERQRYDEYSLLGQDTEMCDAEYAIHAQAEVML